MVAIMRIELRGHDDRFDCENLCQLFFPNSKFSEKHGEGGTVISSFSDGVADAEYTDDNGRVFVGSAKEDPMLFDSERAAIKTSLFRAFSEATGIRPPWGILTGIRPVVFWLKLVELYKDKAADIMEKSYLVLPQKIALCRETAAEREPAVAFCGENTVSLYISIPFCPSRCRYCSFVSGATEKEHRLIPQYLDVLAGELTYISGIIKERGERLLTVYIGGGTPTVLNAEQLRFLMSAVQRGFDMSGVAEYTVEAGRPDTITEEKLSVISVLGATRVSVNPQTLDDNVLEAVGRRHTVADFYRAYDMAAKSGLSVNIDLIAGLPSEKKEGFVNGVRKITELSPDNITVHSLYIKRAADYGTDGSGRRYVSAGAEEATAMLAEGSDILHAAGYLPYYIYRQKNTIGNNENTGYAKACRQCLYNIFMMDDIQTIYGCGAGGMTKLVNGTRIERVCNTKYAYNYTEEGYTNVPIHR